MKPAREPASSRPKPCAFLKKPHESCPFAAPCGPRRKKNDRGQRSAFPSETSRFKPVILAHRGSALPWLVNDRAALRLRRERERERVWSLVSLDEFGRPVPRQHAHFPHSLQNSTTTVMLNLVLSYGIPSDFHDGLHIYRQTPSGQSRVYQITQLLTDVVHC